MNMTINNQLELLSKDLTTKATLTLNHRSPDKYY
jgi:hypothetical protein